MNVAVIGIGSMGLRHVKTYAALKHVNLIAISELNTDRGKNIAQEFHTKYYSSFEKMITQESIDIVSVCVESSSHYSVASNTLNKGIHTLLEKPIAESLDHAEELLKLAKKNNTKLLVGHIERFNPAVKKLKELIDADELGEITSIIARRVGGFPPRATDSDIAIDLSIHDIDIVNYLLNELPKKIFVNKKRIHDTKNEDSVEFFIKYKTSSAYLQANWITPVKIRKLNITGTKGYVEMDYISQKIEFYKSNYKKFKRNFDNFSDFVLEFSQSDKIIIEVVKKEPLIEEINFFIECVKKNTEIDSTFAKEALAIAVTQNDISK